MRKLIRFLWRPAVAFWGTIGLLVLYPMSAGLFVWLYWNVRLPEWATFGMHFFYQPIGWVVNESEIFRALWFRYAGIWVDMNIQPATLTQPRDIPPPPFFSELTGTLLGAWLIWNLVRWVGQLPVAHMPVQPGGR